MGLVGRVSEPAWRVSEPTGVNWKVLGARGEGFKAWEGLGARTTVEKNKKNQYYPYAVVP